ncbi:unnamed protein product [Durusdinium trenchii]|uniref:Stress-response A/B barrel domain-containing protein n=1 Tax=Durusdinium trenchii TaxID=1381693 RepID=A0ABP0IBM8_9DINO
MMLSLQPKTSIDEEMKMIKAMSALPQKLPTILRSQVYTDLRLPGGQSHPSGKNRSLVWLTDFSSWADFEAFESSQDHLSLMISFQSIIEPHSRVSMQYADPLPMIEGVHHIVMFDVKNELTSDQRTSLESSMRSLKQSIREIHSIIVASDLSSRGRVAALVDFTSIEKYQVYEKHPAHLSMVEQTIKPIMTPGTRAAIQCLGCGRAMAGHAGSLGFAAGHMSSTKLARQGAHSLFAGVFIQKMPTDLWCYQQVIHDLRPQYIIDLGSSQGGSAVWFASMLKLFEIPGKVISVDLALEQAYWLTKTRAEAAAKRLKVSKFIDWNYVVGGSKNKEVREKVERLCSEAPCMVVSDSDHDFEHTYYEMATRLPLENVNLRMEWYAQHVGIGQYLIVEARVVPSRGTGCQLLPLMPGRHWQDTNIYGWTGWMNINDPNEADLKKGPMEAANDFEFKHRADFIRTDWCAKHYGGLSQTQNGWFFRKAKRARGLSD